MGARGIAKRTQPYRNERIIKVIRDLYFTASNGSVSVASRFGDLFPTYQGDDGVESREVPVAMVSLVATGVSHVIPGFLLFFYRALAYRNVLVVCRSP